MTNDEKVNDIKEQTIKLLITQAKVSEVRVNSDGKVEAYVHLIVGKKVLTTVALSSADWNEGSPNYLRIHPSTKAMINRLFESVRKGAVISLESIQPTLPGVEAESEVII